MGPMKIAAIVLVVVGCLAVAYGGFAYSKDAARVEIGKLKVSVQETERVNIPQWAGIAAIVAGVAMFVMGGKK